MAPGTRSKFGAHIFEPEVFRKQMYCTEVLVTLLGFFGARGIVAFARQSLRPYLQRAATHLNKPWYSALTRDIREPLL